MFPSRIALFAASALCATLGHAQDTATPNLRPPIAIPFALQRAGFVTLVIEDATGHRVRNLISETPFGAGENVAYWDGLDDLGRDPAAYGRGVYTIPGKLVAPGTYRVRGLWRPEIGLKYQMTPYNEGKPPWQTEDRASQWLTNHTPPRALAFIAPGRAPNRARSKDAGAGQLLVGSSVSEGGSGLAWLDENGEKLWGQEWLGGVWTGVAFLAADNGENPAPGVYAYSAHSWDGELRLQELLDKSGAAPRDTRFGSGGDRPVLGPTWKFPAGTPELGDNGRAMGASGLAARNGLVVVALPLQNALLFVDGKAHRALGTLPMKNPAGLFFDGAGRLVVLADKKLVRYQLPAAITPYLKPEPAPAEGAPLPKMSWKGRASNGAEDLDATFDRNDITRWEFHEAQHPGMWVQLDLGAPRAFSRVEISTPYSPDWTRAYEVYAFDNPDNIGAPIAKGEGKPDLLSIEVPRTTARYLRIVNTGNATVQWSLNEISLFDKAPGAGAKTAAPRVLPAPQMLVSRGLDDPQNLTLDADGNIYVSDAGTQNNVKVFDGNGKLLRQIGAAGVSKAGPYNPNQMDAPRGLALDGRGRLWVAEESFQPKRLSVWNAQTGALVEAFYGPQRYGGGGEVDPRDKSIYYYDGMTFALDYATQKSRPLSIFYKPTKGEVAAGGDSVADAMPQTPIYAGGAQYLTNAYDISPTNGGSVVGLWKMNAQGVARPVALIGQANDYPYFRDIGARTEDFSARWSGVVTAPLSGRYTFSTLSDDGVRLRVNGALVIDKWVEQGATRHDATVQLEAGKPTPIALEYFQGGGGATVHLSWQVPGGEVQIVPASALHPAPNSTEPGLKGEYFRGKNLAELQTTRVDPIVDFNGPTLPPLADKAAFAARLPAGANPGANGRENSVFFFWQDANGDAQMQPGEVTFRQFQNGHIDGVTVMPDASFVVFNFDGQTVRFAPQNFAGGAPHYDLAKPQVLAEGAQHPTTSGGGQALLADDGFTVAFPAPKPYSPFGLAGIKNGEPLWSYPSLWPGLHASHDSPKPQFPGEMIGTTRMLGAPFSAGGGQAGELFALNSNMGQFYVMTTDGLFVATLFKDIRMASTWQFPVAKIGMDVSGTSLHDESFWPFITRTSDGIFASVNGSIVRVEGLDQIQRLPAQTLQVTAPLLARAQDYFVAQEAAQQAARADAQTSLTVALPAQAPVVDGDLGEWPADDFVTVDTKWVGQLGGGGHAEKSVEAALAIAGDRLFAAFKADDANLLANKPEALNTLFKSGGALDLMLGNVAGGQRLVVSQVGGKTVATLYRPRDADAGGEPVKYISMLGLNKTVSFDLVREVSDQVQLAQNGTNYEISVPLALVKLEAKSPSFSGDIGVLRGNGFSTTQRVYWHNKATGLTADLASEAELTPQLWGRFEMGAP